MFDPKQTPQSISPEGEQSIPVSQSVPTLSVSIKEHRYNPLEQVLDQCALSVQPGEVVSLIGPSGCGKSTFLKLAAGLSDPSDGQVNCKASETAILFQEHRLLPWKTLADNMKFGFKGRKIPAEEQIERLEVAAENMGFSRADLDKYPSELSGGMRQRAAIARALMIEPDLLFLDEPFSALDVGRRREMYRLLLGVVKQRRCTVLMVTHDVFEALSLSDRVLVMAANPGRFLKEMPVPFRSEERSRALVADLEQTLLQDEEVAKLFQMQDWDRVL
ncbi:ABC transporter ATP-binding protein [Cohaesibacter celericrescens]|nr:ATP-binding cassette domain-containing protein [Cohaesibacter celericrescens]